jgi:hypothetical protein
MKRRRFSLRDAMALVAATAVGLGLIRADFQEVNARMPQMFTSWPPMAAMPWRVNGFGLLLGCWTLAAIGLQLIPPRPAFRKLARLPGFAASMAGGSGIIFWHATNSLEQFITWERGGPVLSLIDKVILLPIFVVMAMISAWISIAAGERWGRRRDRDWREPLALAVAWAWILLFTAQGSIVAFRD